jgi:hypothetical protein
VRRVLAVIALTAAAVAAAGPAAAQEGPVSGLLVRVQGDVEVGAGESADLVMVISGDAEVRGRAAAVVVVGGTARLVGARVGRLVVVRGAAELTRGTVVEGDVWLAFAPLRQSPGAVVQGTIRRGVAGFGWGWPAAAPGLSLGMALLMLGSSLLAAALAPRRLLAAGQGLTGDVAGTLVGALVLFVVVPAAGVLAFFTVVGLPASLVVLGLGMPLAGLAGFGVAALRLGQWVLRSRAPQPAGAAALGALLLLGAGLVPLGGPMVVLLAAALGAGALARTFLPRPTPAEAGAAAGGEGGESADGGPDS